MNKICPHCGTALPEEASFCLHCAKSINQRTEMKPPTPVLRKNLYRGIVVLVLLGIALGWYFPQRPLAVDGAGEVLYRDEDGTYQLLLGYAEARHKPLPQRVDTVEPDTDYLVPSSLFINLEDGADASQEFFQKVERVTTEFIQPSHSASPMTCTEPVRTDSDLQAAMTSGVSFTSQSGTAELRWTIKMKNGDKIRLRQTYTAQPSETSSQATADFRIATPTDGRRFFLELTEDDDGNCTVTRDRLQAEFPEVLSFSFSGVPSNSGNLDDYLSDTFHMSMMVGSGGTIGSDDQYSMFSAKNDPWSTRCLLLFSDLNTLCGYAIGVPTKVEEGIWRLEVTSCDYDFSALYQERAQAFAGTEEPTYIPPAELNTCGAKWFLYAFNMRLDDELEKNAQLYYLWNQATSPYREHHLRNIEQMAKQLPRGDESDPRYRYYYLFDEAKTLLGYTKLSSRDASDGYLGQNHQVLDGAGEVIYSDADGKYQLLLSYVDSRYLPLPERVDYAELDGNSRVPSCLFINLKDSGADATQGFLQKVERVTTEFIQPADSPRPMTCTDPAPDSAFPDAAMTSSITFTGRSSPAELLWTINMKNGDKILLRQKYTVNPVKTFDYFPEDTAMNTIQELQTLISDIEKTVNRMDTINIHLPPVTYDGTLVLENRNMNFYGNTDGKKRTTFTDTIRITTQKSGISYFYNIDFVGNGGGVGISTSSRVHVLNSTITGWKTGVLAYGDAWVNVTECLMEKNGIGFHFNGTGGSVSHSKYVDNRFVDNETAMLLENVPSDVVLDFSGCQFSGNAKDIDNACNQPIDISKAIFD